MTIDIEKINHATGGSVKYSFVGEDLFEQDFPGKERYMQGYAEFLLRHSPDNTSFDNDNLSDRRYLEDILNDYFQIYKVPAGMHFTLDEFFHYYSTIDIHHGPWVVRSSLKTEELKMKLCHLRTLRFDSLITDQEMKRRRNLLLGIEEK